MQSALLLGTAALLLSNVEAAPRAAEDQAVVGRMVRRQQGFRPDPPPSDPGSTSDRGRPEFHYYGANATSPAGTDGASSSTLAPPLNVSTSLRSSRCPPSVTTSTKTVDVTFYLTATTSYGGNVTRSGGGTSGSGHHHLPSSFSSSSLPIVNSTTIHSGRSDQITSLHLSTGFTKSVNTSCTSATVSSGRNTFSASPSQTTESCDDNQISTSRWNSTTSTPSTFLNSTSSPTSRTSTRDIQGTTDSSSRTGATATYNSSTGADKTSSCVATIPGVSSSDSSTGYHLPSQIRNESVVVTLASTSASLVASQYVSTTRATGSGATETSQTILSLNHSSTAYSQPTASTTTPIPTESCVIDTSMVPTSSAPITSLHSSNLVPIKTICQHDAPTGRPMPGNLHCGLHGLPVGNYFLARFVENAPHVPVTLEGCYQFCNSVMNVTNGCESYRFYPERGLNVPSCDLYGSNVAFALDFINNEGPDLWFDLACGSPSSEGWAHIFQG